MWKRCCFTTYGISEASELFFRRIDRLWPQFCRIEEKQIFFSCLSAIATKKYCGCKLVRASILCVGHTKLSPDRWFGLIKRKLKAMHMNTVLDVEEALLNLSLRPSAGALGIPDHALVPVFTNCPLLVHL